MERSPKPCTAPPRKAGAARPRLSRNAAGQAPALMRTCMAARNAGRTRFTSAIWLRLFRRTRWRFRQICAPASNSSLRASAKQSMGQQGKHGLLRRYRSSQRRRNTFTFSPTPSLRAKRSNPSGNKAGMDCFRLRSLSFDGRGRRVRSLAQTLRVCRRQRRRNTVILRGSKGLAAPAITAKPLRRQ